MSQLDRVWRQSQLSNTRPTKFRIYNSSVITARCFWNRETIESWYSYAIFGKIGRLASEEVTLPLIKSKCIPVLLYGLVVCPLNNTQLTSLDFVINRFLMKLFSTSNMEIITYCREQFDFELPSAILVRHTSLFLDKLRHCDNCLMKNVVSYWWTNCIYMYAYVYVCVYVYIHIVFVA